MVKRKWVMKGEGPQGEVQEVRRCRRFGGASEPLELDNRPPPTPSRALGLFFDVVEA